MTGRVCRTDEVREDLHLVPYTVTAGRDRPRGFDTLLDAMAEAVGCVKAGYRPVYIDDARRGIRWTAGP